MICVLFVLYVHLRGYIDAIHPFVEIFHLDRLNKIENKKNIAL